MSEQTSIRVLPQPDADTRGHFEAAACGELAVYGCDGCGGLSLPREVVCRRCRARGGRWTTIAPRGRVASWTSVTHQVHPAFPVPYVIVLVEHADHPDLHFIGRLSGEHPELVMAQEVVAVFTPTGDGMATVDWTLADEC